MSRCDAAIGVRISEVVGRLGAAKAMRLLGAICVGTAGTGAPAFVSSFCVAFVLAHGLIPL